MWYSAGARTLEDVLAGKGGIKLTTQQEIGIRYYDGKSALPPSLVEGRVDKSDPACLADASFHIG